MKIRKLVSASETSNDKSNQSISAKQDYESATKCIQNAMNILAHTAKCNNDDIVAKESIANLAVVLLDIKGASSNTSNRTTKAADATSEHDSTR